MRRSDIRRADGKHARYYWLLLAESHLTRRLLGACCTGSRRCHHQQDR